MKKIRSEDKEEIIQKIDKNEKWNSDDEKNGRKSR